MSGGYEIQPAPAPMKKVEKQARSYTPISMITYINFFLIMSTEALTARKIDLPDTQVIQMIYIALHVDNDNDEIVYNHGGKMGPYYDKVKDEG